jgi:hypothetical protein
LKTGSPQDERKIGPNASILMGERNDLQAIVGHMSRQIAVAIHHALAKTLIRAGDR